MFNLTPATPCPVREFLLNGGTLEQLKTLYAVDAKRHGLWPNLVHLKYSQIDSPMASSIVQNCRGIILDQDDDWKIVAWPFNKFFNYGEGHAATIDWSTAAVQEKVDGSLMVLYWYDDSWHVATSGSPDASGSVGTTSSIKFRDLFWKTFYKMKFSEPPSINRSYTFMFELTSPYNRVVVPHTESKLTLTGMRNVWNGNEMQTRLRSSFNPVRGFWLRSLEDLTETFKTMDPLAQEGYVIVDAKFNRIKVKHPGYVALHHMKSSFSVKALVEVIRSGEVSEVLAHFPEWKLAFQQVQAAYDGLVITLEQEHEDLMGLADDRKTFALAAQTLSPYPAVHFNLLDKKQATVKDCLRNVQIDKMINLLGCKDVQLEGAI